MKTVKQLSFTVLLLLLMTSVAIAQEEASQAILQGPTVVYNAQFPVTVEGREYEMQTIIMDFQHGAGVPDHMHGGPVLVTVLDGEMTLMEKNINRFVRVGESWTENTFDIHSVVNSGKTTARVVVNILLPKGAEATTIIKK